MGVPGLFAWLRKRYPVAQVLSKRSGEWEGSAAVDNLYIDTNHIIHSCAHATVAKGRDRLQNHEIFMRMAQYLEALIDVTRPTGVVFVAVDGVAPRAKMAQQRTRRFLSAYVQSIQDAVEPEVRREMMSEAGGSLSIPPISRFDSNIITPGTAFMDSVAEFLRAWSRAKVANDPRFAGLRVLVSDASEPAEGEHKIMRFIRALRSDPGYDPQTRHCVYGQDADLLLLALLSHEPHFTVLREASEPRAPGPEARSAASSSTQQGTQQAQVPQAQPSGSGHLAAAAGVVPQFEQVDIGVLREYLQWEFQEFVGPPGGGLGRTDEGLASPAAVVPQYPAPSSSLSEPSGPVLQQQLVAPSAAATSSTTVAAVAHQGAQTTAGGVGAAATVTVQEAVVVVGAAEPGNPNTASAGAVAEQEGGDGEDLEALTALLMGDDEDVQQQQGTQASAPSGTAGVAEAHDLITTPASPGTPTSQPVSGTSAGADCTGAQHRPWWPVASEQSGLELPLCRVQPLEPAGPSGGASLRPSAPVSYNITLERLLDDLVLLTFLAGNDFLPLLPSLDIYDRPSSLDLIFTAYKGLLPQLGSGITQPGGEVHLGRLQLILSRLARDEEAAYARRAAHRRRLQEREQAAAADLSAQVWAAFESISLGGSGWVSMGELPAGVELEELLATLPADLTSALGMPSSQKIDLRAATEEEVRAEFVKRVADRVATKVMNPDMWAADPVGMGLAGYRQRYYDLRFNASGDTDRTARSAARAYLDGILWVYRYYSVGPATICFTDGTDDPAPASGMSPGPEVAEGASWTWLYPHHYSPLISDLCNSSAAAYRPSPARRAALFSGPLHLSRSLSNPAAAPVTGWAPRNGPVRQLLQLLSVLPPRSAAEALPEQLATMLLLAHNLDVDSENDSGEEDEPGGAGEEAGGRAAGATMRGARGARSRDHGSSGARQSNTAEGRGGAITAGFAMLEDDSVLREEAEQVSHRHQHYHYAGEDEGEEEEDGANTNPWALLPREVALESNDDTGHAGVSSSDMLFALASKLARWFPSDVSRLVDFAGKKWQHTGVVRLPHVNPVILASVIQEALRAGARLTQQEQARNTFRPADLIVCSSRLSHFQRQRQRPGSSGGGGPPPLPPAPWSTASEGQAQHSGNVSSGGDVQGTTEGTQALDQAGFNGQEGALAWQLLTLRGPLQAAPAQGSAATSLPAPLPLALGGIGVLGLLAAGSSQATPPTTLPVDIAGLPCPPLDNCRLLPGVAAGDMPARRVSGRDWMSAQARNSSSTDYAARVLGFATSTNTGTSSRPPSAGQSGQGRGFQGRSGRGGWQGPGRGSGQQHSVPSQQGQGQGQGRGYSQWSQAPGRGRWSGQSSGRGGGQGSGSYGNRSYQGGGRGAGYYADGGRGQYARSQQGGRGRGSAAAAPGTLSPGPVLPWGWMSQS